MSFFHSPKRARSPEKGFASVIKAKSEVPDGAVAPGEQWAGTGLSTPGMPTVPPNRADSSPSLKIIFICCISLAVLGLLLLPGLSSSFSKQALCYCIGLLTCHGFLLLQQSAGSRAQGSAAVVPGLYSTGSIVACTSPVGLRPVGFSGSGSNLVSPEAVQVDYLPLSP